MVLIYSHNCYAATSITIAAFSPFVLMKHFVNSFIFPSPRFQLLLGDPQPLLNQLWGIITPAGPGSAPESLSSGMCLIQLCQEPTNKVPNPPQMALLNSEEQRLNSEAFQQDYRETIFPKYVLYSFNYSTQILNKELHLQTELLLPHHHQYRPLQWMQHCCPRPNHLG